MLLLKVEVKARNREEHWDKYSTNELKKKLSNELHKYCLLLKNEHGAEEHRKKMLDLYDWKIENAASEDLKKILVESKTQMQNEASEKIKGLMRLSYTIFISKLGDYICRREGREEWHMDLVRKAWSQSKKTKKHL